MTTATAPHPHVYPVHVEAVGEPVASRWLWLVKWLLAIPHLVVLTFLWIAFAVLSIAAFFAILFTGRYPRAIFDFNVGVLRWTWRVSYYTYGALATDRYPPFTLDEVEDYPTHLQVDYPEHLSRGLVLVKWWLLAIPHYIVVGLLVGGGTWVATADQEWRYVSYSGLVSILVIVAAVILAFTGSYPRPLYDLLLGLNRWVLRVAAYVSLMTDEYPPFRLDMGPHEPEGAITVGSRGTGPNPGAAGSAAVPFAQNPGASPPVSEQALPQQEGAPLPAGQPTGAPPSPIPPPPGAGGPPMAPSAPAQAPGSGWTAGRVISVIAGVVVGAMGLAGVVGGAAMLVLDQGVRDGGFITTPAQTVQSGGYAVVLGDVRIDAGGTDTALPGRIIGDVRLRVTPTRAEPPLFVGIAREEDVTAYLGNVARTLPGQGSLADEQLSGGAPVVPPAALDIWVAEASGPGAQELRWTPRGGQWSAVVMNADGSGGVAAQIEFGAELPWLGPAGVGVLVFGFVLLGLGVVLVAVGVARASRRTA
jgi:hypothetical protein